MYCLKRTRADETEILFDTHRNDEDGRWMIRQASAFGIPYGYTEQFKAYVRLRKEAEKDPDWEYEVFEFLR